MTEALSPPHTEAALTRPPPAPRAERPSLRSVSNTESTKPVEIIAPDQYCAALLLEDAARLFPTEIVGDSGCIVRLQPPPGAEGVVEVLSLVERWLDSIPLPCTKLFYGDRSYLIRASTGVARPATAAELEWAPATGAML